MISHQYSVLAEGFFFVFSLLSASPLYPLQGVLGNIKMSYQQVAVTKLKNIFHGTARSKPDGNDIDEMMVKLQQSVMIYVRYILYDVCTQPHLNTPRLLVRKNGKASRKILSYTLELALFFHMSIPARCWRH